MKAAAFALSLALFLAGCAAKTRHHTIIGFGMIEMNIMTNGTERVQRLKLFGIYGGEFVTGHAVLPTD
jgi:hypothetical protein